MAEKVSIIVTLKDNASKGIKSISKGMKGLALAPFKAIGAGVRGITKAMTSLGGLLGGAAILGGIAKSTKLWKEQNEVLKQTEAVLKSTGGASGLTAQEINKMAGELQKVTNFGDEVTQSGQNMLLTFTNIGKDIFPQVTETMLDMSQAMGQDVKSSAIQLGKALNDPTAGLSALSRVGIQFTEQQKEQIKTLQSSGDMVGAQTVILKELEKQFGGSARAAADSLTQMGNNIGDVGEIIGKTLQPAFDIFATGVSNWINKGNAEKFADQMGKGVQFIIKNLDNLKKIFALTVRAISIMMNTAKTNIKIFAVAVEEIIKRPFQFKTYKAVFTALVDRITDLARQTIQLAKDLVTKGIGAIKAFREKLFKEEAEEQVTFEQKIQQIKKESKDEQIKIENDYKEAIDKIEKEELDSKEKLELEKIRVTEDSANKQIAIEKKKTEESEKLSKAEKKANKELSDSIIESAKRAADGEKDILKATGNFFKDQLKKQIEMKLREAQANLALTAAANWWNPVGWTSAAAIAGLEVLKNEAFAQIDRFQDGGIVGGSNMVGDRKLIRVNSGEMVLNQAQQSNLSKQLLMTANNSGHQSNNNALIREIRLLREEVSQPKQIKLNGQSFAKATYETQRRMIRTGQISTKG